MRWSRKFKTTAPIHPDSPTNFEPAKHSARNARHLLCRGRPPGLPWRKGRPALRPRRGTRESDQGLPGRRVAGRSPSGRPRSSPGGKKLLSVRDNVEPCSGGCAVQGTARGDRHWGDFALSGCAQSTNPNPKYLPASVRGWSTSSRRNAQQNRPMVSQTLAERRPHASVRTTINVRNICIFQNHPTHAHLAVLLRREACHEPLNLLRRKAVRSRVPPCPQRLQPTRGNGDLSSRSPRSIFDCHPLRDHRAPVR